MEKSCIERQEEELQALQAIYMDDFQDLREKPDEPPKVCLKLTPLQSVVAKEVYARVDLIILYTADYPNRSPKLSLGSAEGISGEDVNELQNELQDMAADLVGDVMVLQLAHYVQTRLLQDNKPKLSLYDGMLAEERILAAEHQRLQMDFEANKEQEEDEEKNTETDPAAQSAKKKDADTSPTKDAPVHRKQSGNSVTPLQVSPSSQETEGRPAGYNVMRRSRSSERLGDESFTGTRVIHFTSGGGHTVHCGKCLGQGSSGSKVYSGMNITKGDLVVMREWVLSSLHVGPQMRRTLSITENQQQDPQARLMKQVLLEYVGGGNLLSLHLRKGGLPVAQLREYTQQLVEALYYLHSSAVVHKDLRLSSCRLDSYGNVRLADYSVGKRLSDLYQVYGGNGKHTQSNAAKENNITTSRYGKKGDVYSLGLLVFSLAVGYKIIEDVKDIPASFPSALHDFLCNCLKSDERNRWSASQLREHPFLTPVISSSLAKGQQEVERDNGNAEDAGPSVLIDLPESEEPVPQFSFFTGVSGNSRITCDFEQLGFLGKGSFGNVIKARSKLDNCFYAVKRIPLDTKSIQFIMREVQVMSKLNHGNVVKYYNSWLESTEEQQQEKNQPAGEKSSKVISSSVSDEESLMKLNKIEEPSMGSSTNDLEDFWWQGDDKEETNGSDSSSSDSQELRHSRVTFYQSEDSDEGAECRETGSESSKEHVQLLYLYIQMEYCGESTLRNLIDEGLHKDKERIWRLFREIVEGLVHIHSQDIIHWDLKPENLFLDSLGHIKIGHFGLATTQVMTRGGMDTDGPDEVAQGQSPKMDSSTSESMTSKVGSTLYAAPEVGKQSDGRVRYSQKVDLYSLGIIFFEMCHMPLTTSVERVKVLGDLRTEGIIFPTDFDHEGLVKETVVLKWLLKHTPEERPTSQELLQSQFVPPTRKV
ncbi:eIF-2-alpha kinase GCN2-like isoform X2 [Stylophora pistillata]|uniref:eIF-2-alpha kinase GCN2-like isoform X2 n=1 Tax=Stylophora pistillata TaxID=50429 RepID=UPI000C046996|nr:eIF-2-alpha kinase GCN2-like isoform X2 [Stylophora pistillata]